MPYLILNQSKIARDFDDLTVGFVLILKQSQLKTSMPPTSAAQGLTGERRRLVSSIFTSLFS